MGIELIKCTNCGGQDIEFLPLSRIGRCRSCGTLIFLPDAKDSEILSLLNQAYLERINFEFDKAVSTYEYILSKNPNEICAYEGILLSKYGIIYVKDPKSGENKLTCHRYSPISILEDNDYKNFLNSFENEEEKNLFIKLGEDINSLQIKIGKQLEKEKDYDVFISFKSKTDSGISTEDSLIARDIYDCLTKEGFEVFMSDISLQNRISEDFEPIIFNALHTSEMFILVGTSKENVFSPWVRNEWSRFIDIISDNEEGHYFIPVFKGMSPYDMPRVKNRFVQCLNANDLLYKDQLRNFAKEKLKNPIKKKEESTTDKKEKQLVQSNKWQKETEIKQEKTKSNILVPIGVIGCFAIVGGLIAFVNISSEKKKIAYYDSLLPSCSETNNLDKGLIVEREYSFKSSELKTYVAKCVSSNNLKIELWERKDKDETTYEWKYDVSTYQINNEESNFKWADEEKTAFTLHLVDEENSDFKKGYNVTFSLNISNSNEDKGTNITGNVSYYQYIFDDENTYFATPLSSSLMKIERWTTKKKSYFSKENKDVYCHDVRVVNTNLKDAEFVWNNNQKTSFSISMNDNLDDEIWEDSKYVTFDLVNSDYIFSSSYDYFSRT